MHATTRHHIAMVTGNFPSSSRPNNGAYVRNFALALARTGCGVSVIRPTSLLERRAGALPPRRESLQANGATIEVHRPRYMSFSTRKVLGFNTATLTQSAFNRSVRKAFSALSQEPTVVYGHFLYQAGLAATLVADKARVPSVIGVGEGTLWTTDYLGVERARVDFQKGTGFVAVAHHVRDNLVATLGIPERKTIVLANGVDRDVFYPRDREDARRRFSIPLHSFNIAFVGTFDELKGPHRVVEAMAGLDGVSVSLVGSGPVQVSPSVPAFVGVVPHDHVAEIVSAADVFVLPTGEEGCCNAVLEALACGVPIITSDGTYMDDIVDDDVALRVDPYNVAAIREAILHLMENPGLRKSMSQACLKKAAEFDVNVRARRFLQWIDQLADSQ